MWNPDIYPSQYYGPYTPGKACTLALGPEWVDQQISEGQQMIFAKQTIRQIVGRDDTPRFLKIIGKEIDSVVERGLKQGKLSFSVAGLKALVDATNAKTAKVYADAKSFNEVHEEFEAISAKLKALGF